MIRAHRDPNSAGTYEATPSEYVYASALHLDEEPGRVLLGVSDPGMRSVLGSPLRAEGFEVNEAGDVKELLGTLALSMIRGRRYEPVDVIVCDARDDDEIVDAVSRLRKAGWTTRVLLILRLGDCEGESAALELGARYLFGDPTQALDLRPVVREMIASRR